MRLDKKDMVLYAVTDRHWLNGESLYSQVEKSAERWGYIYPAQGKKSG